METLARLHPDLNRDDYPPGDRWRGTGTCWLQCKPTDPGGQGPCRSTKLMPQRKWEPATHGSGGSAQPVADHSGPCPQQPLSAPLSVAYGGKDTLVDAQWTTDAIARACALGGSIVWDLQADKGHGDVDIGPQFAVGGRSFRREPAAK